ncbi:MAG: potassium-transporting ATPase subunit KdpA, partial [Solimonas sp.]
MTLAGWLQIILVFAVVIAAAWPLGIGMARLFTRTEPLAFESGLYRVAGVDASKEQSWASYTLAMLSVNLVGFIVLYFLQRLQFYLPLDPQGFAGTSEHLAFNTAWSFVANTNWQSYGGETTMSHFVQMAGLTVQNFLSAATGIALAVAVTRAFARSESKTLGNFWVDFTRSTIYVLLPLAIIVAVAFILLGVPQTLQGSVEATTLEGAKQAIALGPVASQEAIKQLGTNGGGFFNANSAHPFENPNAWSNYLSIFAMLVVSAAMPVMFGRMVGDMRQGRALLIVMLVMLAAGAAAVYWAEAYGNPLLGQFGLSSTANLEGKEMR